MIFVFFVVFSIPIHLLEFKDAAAVLSTDPALQPYLLRVDVFDFPVFEWVFTTDALLLIRHQAAVVETFRSSPAYPEKISMILISFGLCS